MRDIIITALFFLVLIYAFRRPIIGLMLYYWFSIMAPHRYTWGFAYDLPFPLIAALVTIVTSIIYYKELKFPKTIEVYFLIIFWIYITITTVFSIYPSYAWGEWEDVSKIFLMTFFILLIVNTRKKFVFFTLAIVSFVGLLGVKGAIFGITSRGQYLVWGPPDSYLADNNFMGVAMVMIIPLCFLLKNSYKKRWIYYSLIIIGISSIITCVLTYSRGALVGLLGMGLFYIFSTRYKVFAAFFAVLVLIVGFNFLPAQWFDRMASIKTYQMDESANQRINSWIFSYNLAKAHPLGGGFGCFTPEQYLKYAPDPYSNIKSREDGTLYAHTAHSIYFEVLAEHGFLGLAIYLTALISLLLSLQRIQIYYQNIPKKTWISTFARALFVCIIGFLISAAFLSRAFFELFWVFFALSVCLKNIVFSENESRVVSSDKLPEFQPEEHTKKQPA